MKNRKAMLEAALFMSNDPLPLENLAKILKWEIERTKQLVEELRQDLKNENHGIHLIETKQGFQLKVKPEFIRDVGHLTPFKELNKGLLRVLALVAYKQPITQSEIVKIIGNRTYEYVKILVEKGLIRTSRQGRTKALVLTKGFADYFGLESIEEAKKLLEDIKIEETESEEETNETADIKEEENESEED